MKLINLIFLPTILLLTHYPSSINSDPIITVSKSSHVLVECKGQNLDSLTIIACNNPDECKKREPCLTKQTPTSCATLNKEHFFFGKTCDGNSKGSRDQSQGCLNVNIVPFITSAIVQCKQSNGKIVTDHYFYGVDDKYALASNPPKSSLISLQYQPTTRQAGTSNITFFTNQPTTWRCTVPGFLSLGNEIEIKGVLKSGAKFIIDPSFISEMNTTGYYGVVVKQFLAPSTTSGFSCYLKARGSSPSDTPVAMTSVNVMTRDPIIDKDDFIFIRPKILELSDSVGKDSLSVTCLVKAYPEPSIRWTQNGRELYYTRGKPTQNKFEFASTIVKRGVGKGAKYSCQAQNNLGQDSLDLVQS